MPQGHPHVGDVGHRVLMTVTSDGTTPVPLLGPLTFRFRRPTGLTFDRDADLVGTGSGGQGDYFTIAGDFDQAGEWEVQLKDGSGPWHADKGKFLVLGNLAAP